MTTTKLTLIEIASNVLLVKKLHVSVRIDPHPVAVGPEGKEKLVASRWWNDKINKLRFYIFFHAEQMSYRLASIGPILK